MKSGADDATAGGTARPTVKRSENGDADRQPPAVSVLLEEVPEDDEEGLGGLRRDRRQRVFIDGEEVPGARVLEHRAERRTVDGAEEVGEQSVKLELPVREMTYMEALPEEWDEGNG